MVSIFDSIKTTEDLIAYSEGTLTNTTNEVFNVINLNWAINNKIDSLTHPDLIDLNKINYIYEIEKNYTSNQDICLCIKFRYNKTYFMYAEMYKIQKALNKLYYCSDINIFLALFISEEGINDILNHLAINEGIFNTISPAIIKYYSRQVNGLIENVIRENKIRMNIDAFYIRRYFYLQALSDYIFHNKQINNNLLNISLKYDRAKQAVVYN